MYQLTCPYCKFKLDSPFVRAGAVITCHKCGQKYQIKNHHVRRNINIPALDEATPLQSVLPAHAMMAAMAAAAETERTDPPDARTASGTARSKSADPQTAEAVEESEDAVTMATGQRIPLSPRLREITTYKPRQKSMLLSAGIIGGLATIGLVVLLVVIFSGGPATDGNGGSDDSAGATDGQTSGSSTSASKTLKLITPIELKETPWEPISARFQPAAPPTDVRLQRGKVVSDGNGGYQFQATINNKDPNTISWATMQLELVNLDQRVFAQRKVFVGLIPGSRGSTSTKQASISTPLGEQQLQDLAQFKVTFELGPRLRDWMQIDQSKLDTPVLKSQGGETVLKISGRNPTSKLYQQADFTITGTDGNGRVIGRWGARYDKVIKPASKFEFGVIMPYDRVNQLTKWQVRGAAGSEVTR